MARDIGEDSGQGANTERIVDRNGHVVLSALQRSESHVTATLSGHLITQAEQPARQILS